MESLKASVRYCVISKVVSITWHDNPKGYFVHFDGSRESINFGPEPPEWAEGQKVKITFEGIDNV